MPSELELSVILTTYQRPQHLERSLASLAMQRGVGDAFEVIVADDGSQDRTHEVVKEFSRTVDFPVRFSTHPHEGYRVALCRNDGVRASRGRYLLFSDGDCVFPPDHLATHLRMRRPNTVMVGNCYRLDEEANARIDRQVIESGAFDCYVPRTERHRLYRLWLKNWCYALIGHPTKPKLNASDFGIWRSDYEAVNGFDEGFVGWGCEDDDLGKRLRRAGVRLETILRQTRVYHLWHPLDPTHPRVWREGRNVGRLLAPNRPTRCERGLVDFSSEAEPAPIGSSAKVIHVRVPRLVVKSSRRGAECQRVGEGERGRVGETVG
jgi:glycosyltransferase involved in cell wall biosynthesis